MEIWRIHIKNNSDEYFNYCTQNNVAALGWCFNDKDLDIKNPDAIRKRINNDYSKFEEEATEVYKKNKIDFTPVKYLRNMKKNDLIWTRHNGIYYIACVGNKSNWMFVNDAIAVSLDACNQRSDVVWHKVGDESAVPGAIATSFIRGRTLQRINKTFVKEYSVLLYSQLTKNKDILHVYEQQKNNKLKNLREQNYSSKKLQEAFYSLLSPADCEDLVYFYLYKEYGYICIPSTNKLSTPLYECVLINPKSKSKAYIQVKKGDIEIEESKYTHLIKTNEKVFLFSLNDKTNQESSNNSIYRISPKDLYDYAFNPNSLLSDSIKKWVDLLKNYCQES